ENGTRQEQKVFRGGLRDLADLAGVAKSPALIVVGSVAQLHEKLAWFNKPA
ncbi:uroporphyrinogen-III C-methyltransferase, partial [Vibrio sp. 10N.222.48.A4]